MSDRIPVPAARRLECYKLAVSLAAIDVARVWGNDWYPELDIWAGIFHERIYGGRLPSIREIVR